MESFERKLMAVLCADVKDYSRHIQLDEDGTIRRLNDYRRTFDQTILEHRGRIANTAGDSVVAEFTSVRDAIDCAINVQQTLHDHNSSLAPEQRLFFRIGIHLGDVIRKGDDILGDGVNIAARIEGIAEAGGISLSGLVYESIRNKVDYQFTYQGKQTLKNISEPVRVYRLLPVPGDCASPTQPATAGTATATPPSKSALKPLYIVSLVALLTIAGFLINSYVFNGTGNKQAGSPAAGNTAAARISGSTRAVVNEPTGAAADTIAVLPFADMSPNKDQGYFADGITEELLNSLVRIKDLQVRGRSSSFYFKGKNADTQTISKMLNVKYLLEGSVRKEDSQVRVSVQLIDTQTNIQLWSNIYDRTLKDIFAIQEDIAKSVASALEINLGVGELGHTPGMTHNVDAYQAFLKGRELYYHLTPATVEPAVAQLQRAVALDPSFSVAWLTLASVCWIAEATVPGHAEEYNQKQAEAVQRAHDATPDSPRVMYYEAVELGRKENFKGSGEAFDRLIANTRKYGASAFILTRIGLYHAVMGQTREAIDYLERARSADPLDLYTSTVLASTYTQAGQKDQAIAEYRRRETIGANHLSTLNAILQVALLNGDHNGVAKAFTALTAVAPRDPGVKGLIPIVRHLHNPAAGLAEIQHIVTTESATRPPASIASLAIWAAFYDDPQLSLHILRGLSPSTTAGAVPGQLWVPVMAKVRKLPAFKDFLRDIGMLAYLRTSGHANDFCRPIGDNDIECH